MGSKVRYQQLTGVAAVIARYYHERGLTVPSAWEAMAFVVTELGEAYDELLHTYGRKWVRNNPEKHELSGQWQAFGEELGDVLMMVMVAGLAAGVNPLHAMYEKMARHLPEGTFHPADWSSSMLIRSDKRGCWIDGVVWLDDEEDDDDVT